MRLIDFLAVCEGDAGWREPGAFLYRAEAVDRLDLALISATDSGLRERAVALLDAMEAVDRELFTTMREGIRRGEGRAAFGPWLDVGVPVGQHYDALDALLAGVLALDAPDIDARPPPPEMVFYQPTPARHIVDCVRRAGIGPNDVVLDLGSGLGHVPLLVNILTGARCHGVEHEAAYVEVATHAATALGLRNVTFETGDAREADFSGVNVFYLFTPFIGTVLRDVLARIQTEAATRPVRIIALGPCTRTLARTPWLTRIPTRARDASVGADEVGDSGLPEPHQIQLFNTP